MPASEIRKDAREALIGKWGKAAGIIALYFILSFVVGCIEKILGEKSLWATIIDLAYTIISVPLSFGLIISFMKLKRDENVSCFDFFKDGFSNFGRSWGIFFYTFIKLLLPIICLILLIVLIATLAFFSTIRGGASLGILLIILSVLIFLATLVYIVARALLYVLAYNIAYDNPDLSAKACVLKSEAIMTGNRGNYFLLQLSFIGWAILACFTFGIGYLWLAPYIQVSSVCFYERIANTKNNQNEETSKSEE